MPVHVTTLLVLTMTTRRYLGYRTPWWIITKRLYLYEDLF